MTADGVASYHADPTHNPLMVKFGVVRAGNGVDEEGAGGHGGLSTLFEMVLGGLVGTSPHMISASVMALARLLHEFATELAGVAPALLPAVLMLLRSKSREVIKSVLGFVKVMPRMTNIFTLV